MKNPWKVADLHVHNFGNDGAKDAGTLISARVKDLTQRRITFIPEAYCIFAESSPSKGHGGHGHHEKYEIMILLCGKANVVLHSKEVCGEEILREKEKALLIPPGIWHELFLEEGTILLVLSSSLYNEKDYFYALPCCNCSLLE